MDEEFYIDAEDFLLDEDELIEMAELFKMFGDSTRIKILSVLFEGEKCVQQITEATGTSQSAVSHQLRLLKQARLVRCRRRLLPGGSGEADGTVLQHAGPCQHG